jgi:hypothetical protein
MEAFFFNLDYSAYCKTPLTAYRTSLDRTASFCRRPGLATTKALTFFSAYRVSVVSLAEGPETCRHGPFSSSPLSSGAAYWLGRPFRDSRRPAAAVFQQPDSKRPSRCKSWHNGNIFFEFPPPKLSNLRWVRICLMTRQLMTYCVATVPIS